MPKNILPQNGKTLRLGNLTLNTLIVISIIIKKNVDFRNSFKYTLQKWHLKEDKMIEILKEYNYWGEEEIQTGYLRKTYIDKFSRYLHNKLVKVILGQRRVGKSFLLRMMIKHLIEKQKVPGKNILYINKDIAALDFINSSNQLTKVVKNEEGVRQINIIFSDKV